MRYASASLRIPMVPETDIQLRRIRDYEDYQFPAERHISSAIKHLIPEIFTSDPSQRPMLHEILDHPFFTQGLSDGKYLRSFLTNSLLQEPCRHSYPHQRSMSLRTFEAYLIVKAQPTSRGSAKRACWMLTIANLSRPTPPSRQQPNAKHNNSRSGNEGNCATKGGILRPASRNRRSSRRPFSGRAVRFLPSLARRDSRSW